MSQVQQQIRTPPGSEDAERGVIGSMLIGGPGVIDEVRARLPAEAFYHPAHSTVYSYLVGARESGMAVDLITFTQVLTDANVLEQVGGAAGLTAMFTFVPTAANVEYYVDIVREKWMLRQMIQFCTEAIRQCYEEQMEPKLVLDDLTRQVVEIGQLANAVDPIVPIGAFAEAAIEKLKKVFGNRGKPLGLPTGFYDLDRTIGGLQAPLTYYIAGRPAMGKSSVMIEIAEHIAIANMEAGNTVGLFSIEMTGEQLVERIVCSRCELDLQRWRDGFLNRETLDRAIEEAQALGRAHIYVDESGALDILEFRARARRMVMKYGVKVILIDYVQRMHSKSRRAQGNREQEINEIAQGISNTAKELRIPIVVLCQLNRQANERPDKQPVLSDLRESGSLEQEARCVILLHRPVYYARTEAAKIRSARIHKIFKMERSTSDGEEHVIMENGEPIPDLEVFETYGEFIVAKQNNGPCPTIRMRFNAPFARWENVTATLFSNNPSKRQQTVEDPDDDF